MFKTKNLIALAAFLLLISLPHRILAAASITGAGATFPYQLYVQWFKEYARIDPSVAFMYQPVGSGAGIEMLLAGKVDFCGADALPTEEQLQAAPGKILAIPTVIGGVAVIYHIPGFRKGVKLTPGALADIFRGKITRWNHPDIKITNRWLNLPSHQIIVVHRSDASGTTGIFSDYLSAVSGPWLREVGRGLSVPWPAGTGRQGNSGVAVAVKNTPYAVGYVELVYALEENLPYAFLRNKAGKFVEPNFRTIGSAVSASGSKSSSSLSASYVDQPGAGSYPIVGLSWILLFQRQDPAKGQKLEAFLHWALTKGQQSAPFLLYVPLPDRVARQALRTVHTLSY
jgi:phosphate transport system substrate-binding protein